MINVREKVFETNSSSCHSITFSKPSSANTLFIGVAGKTRLHFIGEDWGWEFAEYYDAPSKFSYWLNAFIQNNDWKWRLQNEKINPDEIDEALFVQWVEKITNQLAGMFKTFKKHNVDFIIDGFDSWEEYIETFKKRNIAAERKRQWPQFDYIIDIDYGIDHQSAPSESEDCEKLAELSPEELLTWVFVDGSFKTGNDN